MINTILDAILGDFRGLAHDGDGNRWHFHPHPALRNSGDTVKGHTDRMVVSVYNLCEAMGRPVGSQLYLAVRNHDLPFERIMGDWPATLTRRSRFARWAKAIIEWKIGRDLQIRWKLTLQDALILSLCDKLDAVLLARQELTKAGDLGYFHDHFCADIEICADKAAMLGPAAQVWLKAADLHMINGGMNALALNGYNRSQSRLCDKA